jgi:TAG lipase/steryl ester hydrolase/phospholipase A2/LPA acyltransferase
MGIATKHRWYANLSGGVGCRCRQLMAIWPSLHFLKCFSQPWEGDVTIVLPSSYMQIKKSITNPTSDDLLQACQQVGIP